MFKRGRGAGRKKPHKRERSVDRERKEENSVWFAWMERSL